MMVPFGVPLGGSHYELNDPCDRGHVIKIMES